MAPWIFWLLVIAVLGLALGVVAFRNLAHSAFALAGTFAAMAGIYLTMEADFLAMVQLLVYAGAISIILIFGIMLTRREGGEMRDTNPCGRHLVLAGVVSLFFFLVVESLVLKTQWAVGALEPLAESTIGPIAEALLGPYVVPFEVAALLLLVAMVGAILVARGVRQSK